MNDLTIRDADPGDEAGWRALWDAYLAFYAVDLARGVGERQGVTHEAYAVQHVVERHGIERHDVGPALQVRERGIDLARRHGAHAAQVLGQDHVRCQLGHRSLVERVEVATGGQLGAHVSVDLGHVHRGGVPTGHDDPVVGAR